jgi:putative transposase
MLASRRTWWRIAAQVPDQSVRPLAPTRRQTKTPRAAPVLEATGPGQVWSWDITDLRSPWRGVAFKAYSIIDIYSRKLVGYRVEDREADHLAVEMFTDAFAAHGLPSVVHADSGPAMRSTLLADLLGSLAVAQTHNRPRVSNDNPFSESEFRTMKY